MRDIKFRKWNERSKAMDEGFDWPWLEDAYSFNAGLTAMQMDHKVLMQFTGLKDKNGKEIYEGDVIEYPKKGDGLWAHQKGKRVVVDWPFLGGNVWDVGEVIGNIYENPDLLN